MGRIYSPLVEIGLQADALYPVVLGRPRDAQKGGGRKGMGSPDSTSHISSIPPWPLPQWSFTGVLQGVWLLQDPV